VGRDSRRSRTIITVLLVVAFTLITIDYKTSASVGGPRGFVHSVVGGVERTVTAVGRPIGRTASSLAHPNRYRDQAEALAEENAELRREIADDAEVRRQAAELATLRLLADKGRYSVLPARVVAVGDVTGTDWTVTINAGHADGVAPDKLVLDSSGLVGIVESVAEHTSVVRLVCDPDARVGARLEGTRLLGAVAGGEGPRTLTFTLYDASHQVAVGDRLVTFGSLDYAAGVPIGAVTKVVDVGGLSRTAEVRPFVDIGKLDLVGVIVGSPPSDPGDRVLPPRPEQAPGTQPGGHEQVAGGPGAHAPATGPPAAPGGTG
jgi:rod shape-determining protein MreC